MKSRLLERRKLSSVSTGDFARGMLTKIVFLTVLKGLLAVLIVHSGFVTIRAQNDASVSKTGSVTSDSVEFRISTPQSVAKGTDIRVDYTVLNKSNRTIYLVADPSFTDFKVKDGWVFELIHPVGSLDEHLPFSYDFIKIRPQGLHKGNLVLKKGVVSAHRLQDLSRITIRVGFSYLFDVSNLAGCRQATYRLPCLNELNEKSKNLTLGNLVIEIKKI